MDLLKLHLGYRSFCVNRCGMHSHHYYELVYHLSGAGSTFLDIGEEHAFNRDTVVIYRPGVAHNQVMTKEGEDVCLHFSVDEKYSDFELEACLVLSRLGDSYLQNEILHLAGGGDVSILKQSKRHSINCRLSALINDIFEVVKERSVENDSTTVARVKLAYDYINENFRNLKSVEWIAQDVGLSYDYLRHQFKQIYGISLIQHLVNSKINYAKQLLLYTPLLQKQIAEECGFSNIRYFNTAFKKATHQAPGQFRKIDISSKKVSE